MTITFVAAGAAATGNNASVTPGAVSGIAVGDLALILASIRNTGVGTVNTPTGWTVLKTQGSMTILGRFWQSGDSLPLVTFTGGVANADTIARAIAFRGVAPDVLTESVTASQANVSAQNINYPALDTPGSAHALVLAFWKQDDASAYSTPAGMTAVGLTSTTTGDDASQAMYYQIQTTEVDVTPGTITVTGGASAVSAAIILALHPAAAIAIDEQDVYPPRVLVSVTGLSVGADSVRVVRDVGGVETLLRGGSTDAADSSFLVVDAEIPFGVPVTHKAVVNGTARYVAATTTYTLPGGNVAISDAITALAVEAVILAWPDKARDRQASVFRVGGRNVVVMGDLGQFESDITLYFETDTANAQFEELLETSTEGVVQVRGPDDDVYVGVNSYVAITSANQGRFSQDGSDPRRTWTVHAVEVDGWAPELEATGFTYQDIIDFYGVTGTYATLLSDYATYLAVAQADWS